MVLPFTETDLLKSSALIDMIDYVIDGAHLSMPLLYKSTSTTDTVSQIKDALFDFMRKMVKDELC